MNITNSKRDPIEINTGDGVIYLKQGRDLIILDKEAAKLFASAILQAEVNDEDVPCVGGKICGCPKCRK